MIMKHNAIVSNVAVKQNPHSYMLLVDIKLDSGSAYATILFSEMSMQWRLENMQFGRPEDVNDTYRLLVKLTAIDMSKHPCDDLVDLLLKYGMYYGQVSIIMNFMRLLNESSLVDQASFFDTLKATDYDHYIRNI